MIKFPNLECAKFWWSYYHGSQDCCVMVDGLGEVLLSEASIRCLAGKAGLRYNQEKQ